MEHSKLLELLNSMSLEEKIGQTVQLIPDFLGAKGEITGPLGTFDFDGSETALIGSVLNANGAENVKKIQDEFMKNHPHNIPLLFCMDVINGYETIFPIPLAQGCSFDPEMSKQCAEASAREAVAEGIALTFSPMADLVTDSRWGRVMESTGEDPYLNYVFAKALVEGYQGDNLIDKGRIGACIKHFAGYGAPQGGMEYYNSEISERTFLEEYLDGYQGAIDAGVTMAMTSFNSLNRIPSSANKWLMRDILRDKMGFDGVLISDWAAVEELINHTIAENKEEASYLAINAGVDIDMMTLCYAHNLKKLVESGRVSESLIDESVLRILELKNKLGLFENPYKDANEADEKALILCDEHRALARKAAVKSFVMLKNESLLPIDDFSEVAFIGPFTDNRQMYGAWSWVDNEGDTKTIAEMLKSRNIPAKTANGCSVLGAGVRVKGYRESMTADEEQKLIAEAVALAKSSKTVVLCIGEHRMQTGEAASRTNIELPDIQKKLLDEVYKVNENIVLVIFAGRPIVLSEIEKKAKSILYVWYPGTEGANAIIDVLSGVEAPSGKLSISFPRSSGQCPVTYRRYSTGRPSNPKADFNYASGYIDTPIDALYPFGFGLTYTDFEISEVSLSSDTLTANSSITASVKVKNTGKRAGEQVVQMYIKDCFASVIRPIRELKGFEKIYLEPGEEKTVTFTITEKMLRFYNINMQKCSESGKHIVFIGSDSDTQNSAEFSLV